MNLTSQNSTQNLFFKSDKKREFTDVLNEVQSYISSKYSMLVIDGINNVNSGDDNIKQQVKRYIGKYLLDYRISVEGITQTELVDKLYTEMTEFSFLTKYIFGTGIEEININSWDDIEVQYSNGTNVKIDEKFESPEHAMDCEGMEKNKIGEKRTKVYYCHPYSSYERGSNENLNKMVRRWYPKGESFMMTSEDEIAALEKWMNEYPREIFEYDTAASRFDEEMMKLTG